MLTLPVHMEVVLADICGMVALPVSLEVASAERQVDVFADGLFRVLIQL